MELEDVQRFWFGSNEPSESTNQTITKRVKRKLILIKKINTRICPQLRNKATRIS